MTLILVTPLWIPTVGVVEGVLAPLFPNQQSQTEKEILRYKHETSQLTW